MVAAMAKPASTQPAKSSGKFRAAATMRMLSTPGTEPAVMIAFASQEGGQACVCDISDGGVSQPTVSHHLKKLREAGLLTSERCGTWVYRRVEPSVLAAMGQLLSAAAWRSPQSSPLQGKEPARCQWPHG